MPKVTEASTVPTTADNRSRKMVKEAEKVPQRPRRWVAWGLHSLKRAATNSEDCTLD
jgi:hypothetical protein